MQNTEVEISQTVLASMRRMDMMMSMIGGSNSRMMASNVSCYITAFNLWRYLSTSSSIRDIGIMFESPPEGYCFRIRFPENSVFYELSISVPPDASIGGSEALETALFDNRGNLTYNEDLGYEDICRFFSNEEVESEILRLAALVPY